MDTFFRMEMDIEMDIETQTNKFESHSTKRNFSKILKNSTEIDFVSSDVEIPVEGPRSSEERDQNWTAQNHVNDNDDDDDSGKWNESCKEKDLKEMEEEKQEREMKEEREEREKDSECGSSYCTYWDGETDLGPDQDLDSSQGSSFIDLESCVIQNCYPEDTIEKNDFSDVKFSGLKLKKNIFSKKSNGKMDKILINNRWSRLETDVDGDKEKDGDKKEPFSWLNCFRNVLSSLPIFKHINTYTRVRSPKPFVNTWQSMLKYR